MKTCLFFLTGSPGIGKTTLLLKVAETLKTRGYSVGGMISREVRSCGTRVGFEILDLSSDKHGWLAHVNQPTGPTVGKYHVNLKDLDGVGVEAILNAIKSSNVIAIDEIGPMELLSEKFREAVKFAVNSQKLVIGVIHWKARDRLIEEIKSRKDAGIFTVTFENRGKLHNLLLGKALAFLENRE